MTTSIKDDHGAVGVYFNSVVGSGTFGKICRAKCGLLPCVARVFDESAILSGGNRQTTIADFEKECKRFLSLRHPSLIQYLGTVNAPNQELPLFFMEVFNKNLTQFLQGGGEPLPFHMQVNIGYDVALGLGFLHFNSLVHGSLSSNNILLIGEGSRAKITDFGFYKYVPAQHLIREGSSYFYYLAPEVLKNQSFSTRADCFAFGVLLIQIATRRSPGPIGKTSIAESRIKDIDSIPSDHQLLPIALECLNDSPSDRKTSLDLCEQLSGVRKMDHYQTSRDQYITSLQETRQKLQETETLILERDQEIQKLREDVIAKDNNVKELEIKWNEMDETEITDITRNRDVEKNALVEDKDIPAEEKDIPDKDKYIPDKDEDIPDKDKDIPDKDKDIPAEDKDIPDEDKDIPAEDKDIPDKDKDIPAEDKDIPDKDKDIPDKDKDIPAEDKDIPDKDKDIPDKDKDIPAEEKDIPAEDKDIPAEEKDIPAEDKDILAEDKDISGEDKEILAHNILPEVSDTVAAQVSSKDNIASDYLPNASPAPEVIVVSSTQDGIEPCQETGVSLMENPRHEEPLDKSAKTKTLKNESFNLSNSQEQDKSHSDSGIPEGDNNKVNE